MSLSVKAQVLQEATQVLTNVTFAKQRLDEKNPTALLQEVHTLSIDAEKLTELQRKVQATFMQQPNAIPGVNEEELIAISEKLSAAAEILDQLEGNNEAAQGIMLLSEQVNDLFSNTDFQNIDKEFVKSLQERVGDITCTPNLTKGNLKALEELGQLLTQTPQTSPVVNTTPIVAPKENTSELIKEQNEKYQAGLFADQFKDLEKGLKNSPIADFKQVLDFYKTMKSHPEFKSQEAKQTIQQTVQKAETLLGQIINSQAQIESKQVQANQSQQTGSALLLELKTALEKHIEGVEKSDTNVMTLLSAVRNVYSKVPFEDRVRLLKALGKQFTPERTLPERLAGNLMDFSILPGSNTQKLAALKSILPAQQQPTTPPTPVVKEAEKMRAQFEEAKKTLPAQKQAQTFPSTPKSSPSQQQHVKFEDDMVNFDEFDMSQFDSKAVVSIKDLQKMLPLLQGNSSDLQKFLENLMIMESTGNKCHFKIGNNQESLIADRPCFHLYFIHKNEKGSLPNDAKYGNNAMAGQHSTTNQERERAMIRTIAEIALENLDDAVNLGDQPTIIDMLNILEGLKLDAKDLPNGQQNIAYGLFGKMYNLHCQAREKNQSLINPNHSQFKGDFGREGFKLIAEGIDPAIKLAAIQEMRIALKDAWKV